MNRTKRTVLWLLKWFERAMMAIAIGAFGVGLIISFTYNDVTEGMPQAEKDRFAWVFAGGSLVLFIVATALGSGTNKLLDVLERRW